MTISRLKELAYREQDGLEITLLWDPRSNDVCVDVIDQREDSFLRSGCRAVRLGGLPSPLRVRARG